MHQRSIISAIVRDSILDYCNEQEASSSLIACFNVVGGGGGASRLFRVWRAQNRWRDQHWDQ